MPFDKKKKKMIGQNLYLQSQIGEEETFGDLMRRLVRENKLAVFSACILLILILAAILAPVLTPYSFSDMDLLNRLAPPSKAHLFGTDEGGRDIFTRQRC